MVTALLSRDLSERRCMPQRRRLAGREPRDVGRDGRPRQPRRAGSTWARSAADTRHTGRAHSQQGPPVNTGSLSS